MKEPRIEIFLDDGGFFRFRLRGGNGEIMASSEAYTRREDARRCAETFKQVAAEATVTIETS